MNIWKISSQTKYLLPDKVFDMMQWPKFSSIGTINNVTNDMTQIV